MNYLFTNVLAKVAGLTDWHQQPCPFVGLVAAGGSVACARAMPLGC